MAGEEAVLLALRAVHDPMSPLPQRQAAQALLDSLRADLPSAFRCGVALVRPEVDDTARHFGLSLFEHFVKSSWSNFSPEQQEHMKSIVLELLAKGSKDLLVERVFIKEKIADLAVQLAKRAWPQLWPDMIPALLILSTQGETQRELVLLVLRGIPDDMKMFDSGLPERRKRDLQTALNTTVNTLFQLFHELLGTHYGQYVQPGASPEHVARNQRLLLAILNALSAYVGWVPTSLVFDAEFESAFCRLLPDVELRMPAVECLLLFLGRKFRPDERQRLLGLFNHTAYFVEALSKNKTFEDDYQFHKRLGQALTLLGTHQLAVLKGTATKSFPPNYDTFLRLVLTFGTHPSIMLSSFSLPFWIQLIGDADIKQPFFAPFVAELLKLCSAKLLKIGDLKPIDPQHAAFNRQDFDTRDSLLQFFSTYRAKLQELIRLMSGAQPDQCLSFSLIALRDVLATPPEAAPCTVHTLAYLRLESATTMLENVLMGLPKEVLALTYPPATGEQDPVSRHFAAMSAAALEMLFNYKTTDPLLLTRQLAGIKAFTRYYAYAPDAVKAVTGHLFNMLSFGAESLARPSADLLAARRKICTCLIHICSEVRLALLPLLGSLVEAVEAGERNGALLAAEKVLLTEALVEVSNGAKNYELQRGFLSKLLSEPEGVWVKPEVGTCFGDPSSLLRLLGLGASSPEATALRKKLYHLISLFHVIARRAAVPEPNAPSGGFVPCIENGVQFPYRHPFSPHIAILLPNFLLLLRTIHSLWEPSVMSQMPVEWQSMYAVDEAYAASLLGEQNAGTQSVPAVTLSRGRLDSQPYTGVQDETQPGLLRHARHFIENVRDITYRFLQACCVPGDGLYSNTELPTALKATVFSSMENLQTRHWRAILHTFLPALVRNCPVQLLNHVLAPLLPGILSAAFGRFSAEWAALAQRAAQPQGRERAEAIEEIMLRDATREYFEFLRYCFRIDGAPAPCRSEEEDAHAKALAAADPTSAFLVSTQAIAIPLLHSLLGGLNWSDSVALRRVAEVSVRVVQLKAEDPNYFQVLGHELLTAALRTLSTTQNEETGGAMTAIITAVFVSLHTRCTFPQQIFASLPNVTPTSLQDLIAAIGKSNSTRKHRLLFKAFFLDTVGIGATLKTPTILNLPPMRFMQQMSRGNNNWAEATPAYDLAGLFK